DSIDAFPRGADARGDWYDEMLISGDRVIVIGYSYGRGGTEINRFRIDGVGRLRFEDAYHLRSNDYYSSRNYASRLIGNQLIVYSPLYLPYEVSENYDEWMPALRRWRGQAQGSKTGFKRIVSAREIYLPRMEREPEDGGIEALHTVTTCDLAAPELRCRALSILGPAGRTFYVSSNAVYVWVSQWGRSDDRGSQSSMLYRMPLDGRAPSAIGVRGGPVDQFSFREDANEGMLNVLVRGEGGGDAMWSGEFSAGSVALLRLPLNILGDGTDSAGRSHYRRLPSPGTDSYALQNRFVGDYVLYGVGNSWGRPQERASMLVAASVRGGGVSKLSLEHGVDRIEAMGRDAVVVGSDAKALHFSAVELTTGRRPELGDSYTLESAAQGETRSHAFFFRPDPRPSWNDRSAGVLGLPVARAGRPGHRQLVEGSATMIFLRRANRLFASLGEIEAHEDGIVDDGCKASCVDWYGNARPIFLRDRTFALMGYEIVEGELTLTSIREVRRINFAPGRR
ncbi:MAG: beta-propeller domain-containing protein, partial [Micropepsaceae bacterium]